MGLVTAALLLSVAAGNASAQAITITNRPPSGTVGVSYSFQFQATGANSYIYSWSCGAGCDSPVPGLSLSTSGLLSGTPTTVNTFMVFVTATDAQNPENTSGPVPMTVQIELQPLTINTTSVGDATRGVLYSAPLSASGGSGSYTWSLFAGSLPGGLSVISSGSIGGTPTLSDMPGSYSFTVRVSDGQSVAFQQLKLTLRNPAITLSPASLPAGVVGAMYNSAVAASGGTGGPYTYSLSGNAPPNLSLNTSTGAITGMTTTAGMFSFTINVSDNSTFTPAFPGQGYTITVLPGISISPSSIPPADALTNYSQTFVASGGSGSGYGYTISSTPPGMNFNTATGTLSGPPSSGGSFGFTITAHDSLGFTGAASYTLVVNSAITLAPATVNPGQVGTAYSQTFTASGGTGTGYTFNFTGNPIPGMNFSGATLSGNPTTAGSYPFSIAAKDSLGGSVSVAYSLSINNPAITLNPPSGALPAGVVGANYSQAFTASGGNGGPYTYSINGSTPGLTLNTTTGVLSGSPTSATTYNFTIGVSDGSQFTPAFTPKSYSITVNPVITISPATIPSADPGVNYSQTFTASGGSGSGYTFAISVLPPGLSFNPATGNLSGPPAPGGTTSFTITAHDSLGLSGSQNYTLTVNPALTLSPSTLNSTSTGTAYSQAFTASGGSGTGYTYTYSGNPIPELNFNAGTLSGTPTTAGSYSFSVTAKDSLTGSVTVSYTLSVANGPITLSPDTLPPGIVNGNYSQTFVASGGNGGPYTYSINGSTPGLTLNTTTGVLSGAPTSATTYNFTIGVSDGSQLTPPFNPKSYSITVYPAITISPSSIPPADPQVNYSTTFTASGGSGSGYTFTISVLPPGLSFDPGTGILSGPPSPGGTTSFTITAHDSLGLAGSQNYTLTVNAALTLAPATLSGVQIGAAYSQTFTASGGSGTGFTYTYLGNPIPGLNFNAGTLSGTPAVGGTYPFSVTAKDSLGGSVTGNYSLAVSNPPITLAPATLPPGILNGSYSQTFTASGGNGGPYTYSITGSTPGLTLNTSTGVLSGAPTSATTYNFTIGVSDGSQLTPAFTPRSYSITVYPALSINPTSIPSADVQVNYSATFTASGGSGTGYSYAISTPPPGLSINASTGVLSGAPSSSGSFSFTVTARDSAGFTGTSATVTLAVNTALTLSPSTLTSGQVGTGYSQAFTANGGSGGYSYMLVGTPPPGLGLNSNVLSGTPTSSGTFSFSITARDSLGGNVTNSYSLAVANPPIVVQPTTIATGQVGVSYSQPFTASGGNGGPYAYSITGGSLFGLSFNAGTATLGGIPTSSGSSSITISATDGQLTGQRSYTFTVAPPGLTLTPSTVANGIVGVKYSQTFTVSGGVGTYTFTLTPPNPAGLTFSASGATGTLSGTPATSGSFPFTVQVTDGTSTFSRSYTLAVSASSLSILTTSLPNATQNAVYSASLSATGGTPPYTWTISPSNALPGGLTLIASGPGSGSITGTPGSSGTFPFSATVTDSLGSTATAALSIVVQTAPLMFTTTSPLPPALNGAAYSVGFGATGGTPPYSFALTFGPPGLGISGSTLSGTLTNSGTSPVTYNLTVKLSDSGGNSISSDFQLTVQPAAPGLILSAGSLSFTAPSAGAPPVPQYVSVSSTTLATVAFSVGLDQSWLSASPGGGNTPATLQINVNQKGLAPGRYSGNITVTGPDGPHMVSVGLTVVAQPAQLSVAPTIVTFTTDGMTPPLPGAIEVFNTGDGTINFSASVVNGSSWVALSNSAASVNSATPAYIPVNAVISGLGTGDYRDVIHIDSDAGSADVPVTLLVSAGTTVNLVPAGSLFSARQGQGLSSGARTLAILATGMEPIDWTATLLGGSGWLTLNTASGTSATGDPGVVSYTVDPTNLGTGNYYARIHIDAPSATNTPVDFVVVTSVEPASNPAEPDPSPAGLLFISSPGSLVPPAQTITINTSSTTPISFSAAANTLTGGNWLMVAPTSGTSSSSAAGQVSVTVNPAGLAPGVYQGTVSFTLQGNPTAVRTVNVSLLVTGTASSPTLVSHAKLARTRESSPGAAGCSPSKLVAVETGLVSNFSTPAGWPTPLAVQLVDDCGNAVTKASAVASFSNGDAPVALLLSDTKNAVYSATWNPHGASSQVTVSARATAPGLQAVTAQIVGAVSPNQVPILYQHGTIHNLNPQAGAPLAPGTIVQIYGSGLAASTLQTGLPLPTNVNGTTVIIGGVQAPLYYVSDGQLNAELPLELLAGRQYQILVSANGALTTPDTIDIEPVTPGVAAQIDGTIIAQHVDGSYVTTASPAHPGEVLTIYLAGMGLTDVPVMTGQQSPSDPLAHPMVQPTVTVNGEPAQISFAGLTPQSVGLYQINFTIPMDAPPGNLKLVVAQGTVQSNVSTVIVQQ